jgi:hypothetical protein
MGRTRRQTLVQHVVGLPVGREPSSMERIQLDKVSKRGAEARAHAGVYEWGRGEGWAEKHSVPAQPRTVSLCSNKMSGGDRAQGGVACRRGDN